MRRLCGRAALSAILLAASGALARSAPASADFAPLDVAGLLSRAKEYRHRASLLRKMIGARESSINSYQQQADAAMRQARQDAAARATAAAQAQAQAQSTDTGANLLLGVLGNMPGGGLFKNQIANQVVQGVVSGAQSSVDVQAAAAARAAQAQNAAEDSQADAQASSLEVRAKALEGEKKKLAYTAMRYEQLADADELLAAVETLRLQAKRLGTVGASFVDVLSRDRRFLARMSLW